MTAGTNSSPVPLSSVHPDDYPKLTREGLGALKFNWRKSHVQDDWTKGGELSGAWDRISGWPYWKKPSYDLDYGLRVMAKIAQEVPAWRDMLGGCAHRLMERMGQYAAWFDWVEETGQDPNRGNYSHVQYRSLIPPGFAGVYNSPGYMGNGLSTSLEQFHAALVLVPGIQTPAHPYYPSLATPVGRTIDNDPIYGNGSSNMNYRGYFAHQLMLSYVISGDKSFLDKQQLVYDDEIHYEYGVEDMVRMLCEHHLGDRDSNGSPLIYGIDCEVGKMFPVCVSVGGLAAHLYDQAFGTDYRKGYDRWLGWAKENITGGNDEPDGPFAWCAPYVDRDIPYVMNEPHQQMGAFFVGPAMQLIPNEPEWATQIYEGMFQQFGRQDDDGLHIVWPPALTGTNLSGGDLPDFIGTAGALTYAREVGDVERAEALESWMSKHGGLTYEDGEFYVTFGLEEEWPRGIPNAWATLGYIGGAGSIRKMYNEPNFAKFDQPSIVGVDYPGVNVTQASYDPVKDALIVSIAPGAATPGAETTFTATQLTPGSTREVLLDGQPFTDWSAAGPGQIVIRTTVAERTFVIR